MDDALNQRLESVPLPVSLDEVLREPAAATRSFRYVSGAEATDDVVSFATLALDARRFAAAYREAGVGVGDRVALMIPDSRAFVTAFFGALHLGAVPVPIYPPMRIDSLSEYLEQARHIVETSGARLLVTSSEVRRVLGSLVGGAARRRLLTTEALWRVRDEAPLHMPDLDDLAFLQFTSGSTSRPRGVMLTHRNLGANIACIARGLQLDPATDVAVSWLPLYHDMGLIGCVLTCVARRLPLVLIPPLDFLKRPARWLRAIADHGGTLSFAPDFAYGLAARRVRDRDLEGVDLSRWRVAGCGAEPIQRTTLERFAARFAEHGFSPDAFLPSYGLAESTLAVSFAGLGGGAHSVFVSRASLVDEARAVAVDPAAGDDADDAVELVTCGRAFAGHEIGILGPGGLLEPGGVGEVVVRGPSVTGGYFGAPQSNDALFHEGWLRTGDLGFVLDGELAICGRLKDLIIVNGRNHYATDVERAAGTVEGLRPGQVIAFGVRRDGREQVVVCAELRGDAELAAVEADIRAAVLEQIGLRVGQVVLLPRGTIPKTSSGKVRRQAARALFLEQRLAPSRDSRPRTVTTLAASQLGLLRHEIHGFLDRLSRAPARSPHE